MATVNYQGIIFPDRAESIPNFPSYRVFLDHWNGLSTALGERFEGVALRGESRVLAVHGEQGRGKTLFAQQLAKDFDATRVNFRSSTGTLPFEESNLWHRIAGGLEKDPALVWRATNSAECIHIEDEENWLTGLLPRLEGNKSRNFIVIADNAERTYFRRGLVELGLSEYLAVQDQPQFLTMVAQRLVHLCRTKMSRCLFVALSNDQSFLTGLQSAVEAQHEGLFEVLPLPAPGARDKETIVRINTNRLNQISYWFCLDKAGPDEKKAVYSALNGADSFPASFRAVNNAIRRATPARTGRPAKKNVISLIALCNAETLPNNDSALGDVDAVEIDISWFRSVKYRLNWAKLAIADERERGLLESEWQFRAVYLGNPFVRSLLSNDMASHSVQLRRLLDGLKPVYGPGTLSTTRDAVKANARSLSAGWIDDPTVDVADFWARGQARSTIYEPRLSTLIPEYNRSSAGFLTYRPDAAITAFHPCSILNFMSDDQTEINAAIRRDAHVFEFSAFAEPTPAAIQTYLKGKLINYVKITQEQ